MRRFVDDDILAYLQSHKDWLLALAGALGETALTLKLLESGPQEIVFTHSWIIQLNDPLEERSVYIRLRRVTFPAFGRYEFVLWVNDEWFAHCNISVLNGSLA